MGSPRAEQWPWLLAQLLTEEYFRQRDRGVRYASDVFKDRDDDYPYDARSPEKKSVKDVYHGCHQNRERCGELRVGDRCYWLLGYEWPNQASDRMARADLVGLTLNGGLVVFECKLVNEDRPFAALLQGLDYLSCLTSESNFDKLLRGFDRWVAKPKARPPGFQSAAPLREGRHEVIVLASPNYYAEHRRKRHDPGWESFAGLDPSWFPSVEMRFAESSFSFDMPQGAWVKPDLSCQV
jgi:hypothetical protein